LLGDGGGDNVFQSPSAAVNTEIEWLKSRKRNWQAANQSEADDNSGAQRFPVIGGLLAPLSRANQTASGGPPVSVAQLCLGREVYFDVFQIASTPATKNEELRFACGIEE